MKSIINREHINYLNIMAKEMEAENLSIFAGAGISIDSGFVDWKGLMRPIIEQLEINPNMDLALAAQFYENEYGRHDINKLIFDEFNRIPRENEVITLLGKLPIKSYWTTNYDSLIEDTLSSPQIGKVVDLKINKDQFKYHVPNYDVTVYKMHGDKRHPDEAIITKNDYETYDTEREVFTKALFTELITNTFLFIGFSFSDPNLERILSIVKHTFDNNAPKNHYCFMRRVQTRDYKDLKQYKQDSNFQKLRIREMRRYGIQTILIDDFKQIIICLKYIKAKLDQKRVFISGSIIDTVSKDSNEAELVQFLAQKLVENNYKIVTGFGQNIGNYLLIGACANMNFYQTKNLHKSIEIYPLVTTGEKVGELRKELISDCGCIITLFGKYSYETDINEKKLEDDGIYQEFKAAEREGITLLPIGCTGKTSAYLWNYTNSRQASLYEDEKIKPYWLNLNNSTIQEKEEILNSILKLLEHKNVRERNQLEIDLLNEINKKKVFLSFHYNSSHELAEKYRNLINQTKPYTATEEEKIDRSTSESEIYKWIEQKISNTIATVLIYDDSIFESKYVEYEIKLSVERNNNIIVIVTNHDVSKVKSLLTEKFSLSDFNLTFYEDISINSEKDILKVLKSATK